ncbi:ATP-grasp domain-containing protein [Streptomyces sp. C10-9-1]|uniref:ATP-grasp domain-containing protein n=1 Tax=Streptomyces sp. C10-9-1 TaxID=1859285 RepID=UPI003F49C874
MLLHLPSRSMLESVITHFEGRSGTEAPNGKPRAPMEIIHLTEVFRERGWRCLYCSLCDIEIASLRHRNVYDVATGTRHELTNSSLNTQVDAVVARLLGPVESRRDEIQEYFEKLWTDFTGTVVNHPASVLYGLRKDYLFEYIDRGFRVIPTRYFEPSVSLQELTRACGNNLEGYIVKPVTGELGNSFMAVHELNEKVLRHKEPLVGGWLLQPFNPHVWDGEYQIFFVGERIVHGMRKFYPKDKRIGLPARAGRIVERYAPTSADRTFAREARVLWTEDLGKLTDLCRVDFVKEPGGLPVLLEFEAVNPGFSFGKLGRPRSHRLAEIIERHIRKRVRY